MLRKALATLPPTLDKTYERILAAIDEIDADYAIRILCWLAFSERPLSIGEVSEVVAIDVDRDPAFNQEEVLEDPQEVLEICSSLVTTTTGEKFRWIETEYIKVNEQVVRLAHYSVKEYLVSNRIQEGQAARYSMQAAACHINMARACLGYLEQFQSYEPLVYNELEEFKLARYSADYWASHIPKSGDRGTEMNQEVLHLLSADNPAYLNWVRICNPENYGQRYSFELGREKLLSPLCSAALLDLEEVTKLLLDNGADVNAQDGHGRITLQMAITYERGEIVRLLLDRGADINAQSKYHDTPLQEAIGAGRSETVRLLLDRGADITTQNGNNENPLWQTSAYGWADIVRLMLDKGADITAQDKSGQSPLSVASRCGHKEVVSVLLNHGANPAIADKDGCMPLESAIAGGRADVVELLLKNGAAKTIPGTSGSTPLDFATDHGQTLLHLAAGHRRGCMESFQYYIGLGLDPTAVDAKGYDVLYYASSGSCVELVKALLNKDTKPLCKSTNWSPVHWACRAGNSKVVELLVEAGFHTEPVTTSHPERQWSPLDITIYHGYEGMLDNLSTFCRSRLGAETSTIQHYEQGFKCNGCTNVSGQY
jgi:ankyrin repeat protein